MQDIVKLLVDSFGSQVLEVMGIVYTHASHGLKTHAEAERKTTEIAAIIAERLGLSAPPRLPFWQLECVPQDLAKMGVPADRIAAVRRATNLSIEEILRWSTSSTSISTVEAVYGEYEAVKAKRLAEEAAAAARENAVEARFNASVVSTREETKVDVVSIYKQPVYRSEHRQIRDERNKVRVFYLRAANSHHRSDVYADVPVLDHEDTFVTKQKYVRRVETLGCGKEAFGEWQKVGEAWEERA